ncbi:MAG: FAD-dependent monooxygenase [Sphingosinicella sp.]
MDRADVLILGGGLVGLTLALALSRYGLSAIVVDPADPATLRSPGYDGRVTAVSSSSWRMLQALGIGEDLAGRGCPIDAIRVADGLEPGALEFRPDEGEADPLGMMFENKLLRAVLHERAAAAPDIALLMPAHPGDIVRDGAGVRVALDDGRALTAPLLVGADGRHSPAREAANIPLARWSYDHAAIVATIAHQNWHENVAYEIFYPDGPFAILPMLAGEDGRPRSAIVWSAPASDAPALIGLPEPALAHELEKKMGGFLGPVTLAGPRWSYPLGFHHAATITGRRLALVGDAAHAIHPIAGQGLNLGMRDVAALAEVLVEGARIGLDLGDAQLLARYQNWRSLDSLMVAFATDSLTRLYAIPGRAASALRRLGMGMVQRIGPIKRQLTAEARGESGDLPLLLRGLTI